MTTPIQWDERRIILAILNHYEDMATAAEDADLVFAVMALKQSLNLPLSRPCVPPN